MSFLIYSIIVLIVAFVVGYYVFVAKKRQSPTPDGTKEIPFAPGSPLQQAWQLLTRPPFEVMIEWMQRVGGTAFRLQYLNYNVIVLSSAEMAKTIFASKLSNYRKSQPSYAVFGDLLGTGLVTSEDERWRHGRALIAPPFKRDMLQAVVPLSVHAARRVSAALRATMQSGQPLDLAEEFRHMTLQVIGEAVLGMSHQECDASFPGLYLPIVTEVNIRTWHPYRAYLPLPSTFRYKRCVKALNDFVVNLIKKRITDKHLDANGKPSKEAKENDDILDKIIISAIDSGDDVFDIETIRQLRDEIKTFLLAGHETSSMMLTWSLIELARHPEALARVRAEADAMFTSDDGGDISKLPTPEELKAGLSYTECVLKETLRLHSIVPILARTVVSDDVLDGYHVAAGSTLIVLLQKLHHDPTLWPEPMAFKPERFIDVDTTLPSGHRYAFMPFGAGPRICIGQFFALLESKIVLSLLVRQFDLVPALPMHVASVQHPYVIPIAPLHGLPITPAFRKR